MKRREFIECALGMAVFPTFTSTRPRNVPSMLTSTLEGNALSTLLPAAGDDLAGKESERGFAQALARLSPMPPSLLGPVVVPSASALKDRGFLSVLGAARLGSTVLIDLADGFACFSDRVLTRTRLRRHLGITVAHPAVCTTYDYISYRWPMAALVRHFSRVSYIDAGADQPIAYLGPNSVAVRKRVGRGSILIFGSALGSLLLAGDEQAHQIFAAMLATET